MNLPNPQYQSMEERRETYETLRRSYLAVQSTTNEDSTEYGINSDSFSEIKNAVISSYNKYLNLLVSLNVERDLSSNAWQGFKNSITNPITWISIGVSVGVTCVSIFLLAAAVASGGLIAPLAIGTITTIGAASTLYLAGRLSDENKFASAMAAIYGINADEYKNAESALWEEVSTTGLMILSSMGAAKIFGPGIINSKPIKNIYQSRMTNLLNSLESENTITLNRKGQQFNLGRYGYTQEGNNIYGKGWDKIIAKHSYYRESGVEGSKFPSSWTKEDILSAIMETVQDGELISEQLNSQNLRSWVLNKIINNVKVQVIVNPDSGEIITAYPLR
jgi:hypothetical protein